MKQIAPQHEQASSGTVLSTRLLAMLAVAAGLAIGNLYWAQPLLVQIPESFGADAGGGGFLLTATQAGYAAGILLIVPLGDVRARHRMIPLLIGLASLALLAAAASPSMACLAAAFAATGFFTVSGQVIVPMVGDLAPEKERGRMLGLVASGITTGILFSRFVSGMVAGALGWRAVFLLAAVLNLAALILLAGRLPRSDARASCSYGRLLASVVRTGCTLPGLPSVLLLCGIPFCVFNMFWVTLTFLLSAGPYGYSTFAIGLVSLAGLAGALAAGGLGRLGDSGHGFAALGCSIALMGAGMSILSADLAGLFGVLLAAVLVSVASQGTFILTQTALFLMAPQARSRVNAIFVVSNFVWAAAGSALASVLWTHGGPAAEAAAADLLCAACLAVWCFKGRGILQGERSRGD